MIWAVLVDSLHHICRIPSQKVDSSIRNKCLPPYLIKWIAVSFLLEKHNGNIRLARALLTLIGSCRIYYVFQLKSRALSIQHFIVAVRLLGKKSYYHQYSFKYCSKHASRIERNASGVRR